MISAYGFVTFNPWIVKKAVLYSCVCFMIFPSMSSAQSVVDVSENTIKVSGLGEQVFYYSFDRGDQIVFNFEEINGKELKELEITELPSSSKFMDYKTKKIHDKIIQVNQAGVYKFRFLNSSLGGRVCRFKVQRIPASGGDLSFNTNVYWRTIYDTTYSTVQERYLISSDTIISEIYNLNSLIPPENAPGGSKNYQIIDFSLPLNTISWSFYLGTGRAGKTEYMEAKNKFLQYTSPSAVRIPGYGPMAALAITGVSYFNRMQGGDNVKYWFIQDQADLYKFQNGQPFRQYKQGDVLNEACRMKAPLTGKIYLALMNDNLSNPIALTLNVTAIVVNQKKGTRPVQKAIIKSRQVPYSE